MQVNTQSLVLLSAATYIFRIKQIDIPYGTVHTTPHTSIVVYEYYVRI